MTGAGMATSFSMSCARMGTFAQGVLPYGKHKGQLHKGANIWVGRKVGSKEQLWICHRGQACWVVQGFQAPATHTVAVDEAVPESSGSVDQ